MSIVERTRQNVVNLFKKPNTWFVLAGMMLVFFLFTFLYTVVVIPVWDSYLYPVYAWVAGVKPTYSDFRRQKYPKYIYDIEPTSPWQPVNLTVHAGDIVRLSASGQVTAPKKGNKSGKDTFAPSGWQWSPNCFIKPKQPCKDKYVIKEKKYWYGALMAKIGAKGKPFLVGDEHFFVVENTGKLYFGFNYGISDVYGNVLSESALKKVYSRHRGKWMVTVTIAPKDPNADIPVFPVRTKPKGWTKDKGYGPYYENYSNSMKPGIAYKYPETPQIYVWDGRAFRKVIGEDAFRRFYGCKGKIQVIKCAPVYMMPTWVNENNMRGYFSDKEIK